MRFKIKTQSCQQIFLSFFLSTGGNFGLFTGMSILSMFEIGFWLIRFIFSGPERDDKIKDKGKKHEMKIRKKRIFPAHEYP